MPNEKYSVVFARDCKFHGKGFKKGQVLELPELTRLTADGLTLEIAVECIEFHLDMYLPDNYGHQDGSPYEIVPVPDAIELEAVRRSFESAHPEMMFSWKEGV